MVVPAAVGAGGNGQAEQTLRQRDQALAARSRSAVLSLYALETKLARARSELASVQGQAYELRRERALVADQLAVARRGVAISQRRLAERLRALYEQEDVDPLAIVLGADSLDAAMTGLDNLGQMASSDRRVLAQVRGARTTLVALQGRLADRQARLARLVAAAAATAQSLAGARAARAAYVARLGSERSLTRAAIARLELEARAAQLKASALAGSPAQEQGVVFSYPTAPVDPTAALASAGGRLITVVATGYALPGRTATGLPVGWGVVAVDPSVIPLGTRMTIPGYGAGVAADIGSGVRGAMIDLWFPTVAQAEAWGRRSVTIALQ